MKLGLRGTFLSTTLGLILIGMLLSAAISFFLAKNMVSKLIEKQLDQQSESIREYICSFIENRRQDIILWSKQSIMTQAVGLTAGQDVGSSIFMKETNEALISYKTAHPYFEEINICNSKGEVITTSQAQVSYETSTGKVVQDKLFFQKAFSGAVFLSAVEISGENPVFTIAAPIKEGSQITGVLYGVVNLNYFSDKFISSKKIGSSGYVFIFDKEGMVVSHRDTSKILKLNVKNTAYGRTMLEQKNGLVQYDENGAPRIASFKLDDNLGWTIAAVADLSEQMAPVRTLLGTNFGSAVAVLLFAGLAVFFLSIWVSRPIREISRSLDRVAEQVSNAATQISQSSQMLAQGASEQASSIEETSASLEELASMANHNADNAQQASILANEARLAAANGTTAMDGLMLAMNGINQSSQEVAKVAKGIEEIAFQTNLLALNAAVEAARAGEAGRGFAVVAEEVRNLAQRASDHAKTTSTLITESRTRSNEGTRQAGEVNRELKQIFQGVEKVVGLVTEISAASKEQAQGIDQINRAVSSMDQVVQQNSASSEQSASASQELSAQAFQMKALVRDLSEKVAGGREEKKISRFQGKPHEVAYTEEDWAAERQPAIGSTAEHAYATARLAQPLPAAEPRKVSPTARPEEIIPFDDDDLKDL